MSNTVYFVSNNTGNLLYSYVYSFLENRYISYTNTSGTSFSCRVSTTKGYVPILVEIVKDVTKVPTSGKRDQLVFVYEDQSPAHLYTAMPLLSTLEKNIRVYTVAVTPNNRPDLQLGNSILDSTSHANKGTKLLTSVIRYVMRSPSVSLYTREVQPEKVTPQPTKPLPIVPPRPQTPNPTIAVQEELGKIVQLLSSMMGSRKL